MPEARPRPRTNSSPWAGDHPRYQRTLLHDRARPPHRPASQRRLQLHGEVSRKMWQRIWPDVPESEIPINSITNGVHTHPGSPMNCPCSSTATSAPIWPTSPPITPSGIARRQNPRRRTLAHPRTPPRTTGHLRPSTAQDAIRTPRRIASRDRPRLRKSSTPKPSPSASPAASPPTNAAPCSSAIPNASSSSSTTASPRAVHLRRQGPPAR